MEFFCSVLRDLDVQMTVPEQFGWFHLLWIFLTVLTTVLLCVTHKMWDDKRVRRIVFITAVIVTVLEIYKQLCLGFYFAEDGTLDYEWSSFPWQFCSMPMYVGLLTGIFRKGRVHTALNAFLATYATFAGLCVMVYPGNVFIDSVGINVQTMVCHGSMVAVGVYLLYSGYVKLHHKTLFSAMTVFVVTLCNAVFLNEVIYCAGVLGGDTFNLFFVSPYFETPLPIYSWLQANLPFPICLAAYFAAFSLAAYLVLLLAMLSKKLYKARGSIKDGTQ